MFLQRHTFVFSTIKDYSFLLFPYNVKFLNLSPNLDSMWCCLVSTSCLTHESMDRSLTGSSVHRIFQARILEWVAVSFSFSGDLPDVGIELAAPALQEISCTAGIFFTTHQVTREAHYLDCITKFKHQF